MAKAIALPLILSLLCIATAVESTVTASAFLEATCKTTRYPNECLKALAPNALTIVQNPTKLAETTLSVSLSKSQSVTSFLLEEARLTKIGAKEHAVLKDCLDGMDDTLDHLSLSVRELQLLAETKDVEEFSFRKSNVKTWVSAVVTNYDSCVGGFDQMRLEGRFRDSVVVPVVEAQRITSVALAFINHIPDKN
ncbi:hypothetical protein LguiB_004369 [Lonicera macranthoides]